MTETKQQTWGEVLEVVRRRRGDYHTRQPDECPACGNEFDEQNLPAHMRASCEGAA